MTTETSVPSTENVAPEATKLTKPVEDKVVEKEKIDEPTSVQEPASDSQDVEDDDDDDDDFNPEEDDDEVENEEDEDEDEDEEALEGPSEVIDEAEIAELLAEKDAPITKEMPTIIEAPSDAPSGSSSTVKRAAEPLSDDGSKRLKEEN